MKKGKTLGAAIIFHPAKNKKSHLSILFSFVMPQPSFQHYRSIRYVARDDPMIVQVNETITFSFSVWGEPIPQPRMRLNRRYGQLWDPANEKRNEFNSVVRRALEEVGTSLFPLFENGTKLKVMATFHVFDSSKDVDNLAKFLLDALEKVVFKNDNMVVLLVATKTRTTRNLEFTDFEIENIVDDEE